MRDVVLTLTLGELDHRHVALAAEPVDRGDERLADRIHQRRGGERRTPMPAQEPHHPVHVLQPRLIHVQIQPVDALDLQRHVLIKDIADAARYRHHKLRSTGRPIRVTYRHRAANDGKHAPRVTPDRSPPTTPLVGLGRSPVRL